jgi:hypothetical protein
MHRIATKPCALVANVGSSLLLRCASVKTATPATASGRPVNNHNDSVIQEVGDIVFVPQKTI